MATNIEKALYQAPDGEEIMEVEGMMAPGEEIELPGIEIETNEDGSVEITIGGKEQEEEAGFDANLAEYLDENTLQSLADELVECVDGDVIQTRRAH